MGEIIDIANIFICYIKYTKKYITCYSKHSKHYVLSSSTKCLLCVKVSVPMTVSPKRKDEGDLQFRELLFLCFIMLCPEP